MKPWINYHHLYYFMTIAELNSISKAAEKLSLGQPTLSAQLKVFEDHLGVQLFERNNKKLMLTEHGKLALDYARNIFKLGGEMYEALHDRLRPSRINLSLGALDSIPKQVMLELTQSAVNVSPCMISLIEGNLDYLLRELLAHKIDLLITNHLPRGELTKGLHHKVISKRQIGIYGSRKFIYLKKDFPKSLNNVPIVLPTFDSQMRYEIEHWFRNNNVTVDVLAETQDTALKKLMATSDMAIIPAASHTVRRQIKSGELHEIGVLNDAYEQLYLVSSHRKINNPIASILMKEFALV